MLVRIDVCLALKLNVSFTMQAMGCLCWYRYRPRSGGHNNGLIALFRLSPKLFLFLSRPTLFVRKAVERHRAIRSDPRNSNRQEIPCRARHTRRGWRNWASCPESDRPRVLWVCG